MKAMPYMPDHSFEYKQRSSLDFGDTIGADWPCRWSSRIYSSNGAWYHAYFPKCADQLLRELIKEFKYQASLQGDPVKFSYSFIEEV